MGLYADIAIISQIHPPCYYAFSLRCHQSHRRSCIERPIEALDFICELQNHYVAFCSFALRILLVSTDQLVAFNE